MSRVTRDTKPREAGAGKRREAAKAAARRRRGRGAVLVAAAGLIGLVAVLVSRDQGGPPAPRPESTGIRFRYLDGRAGSLADFDRRPLVLNFFASWCPTCWAEMADFQRVYLQEKERVGVLGLALQETEQGARAIVKRTGVTYPLGSDPTGEIFSTLGGLGMPTTVFFDERGQVVEKVTGGLDEAALSRLIRQLFVEKKRGSVPPLGCVPEEYPVQGREHVVPEGPPGAQVYRAPYAWNSDPPTSGWHDPAPAPWGVHDTPIHPAVLVHNLEHGGVVVQYRDLPKEAVKGLAVLLQQDSPKLVLAPSPSLKAPIVATAWGRLMACRHLEPDSIRRFVQNFRDQGPENAE